MVMNTMIYLSVALLNCSSDSLNFPFTNLWLQPYCNVLNGTGKPVEIEIYDKHTYF